MKDKIIGEVCRAMSADLTAEQLRKLESILYIEMKDVRIEEQKYEIEPAETYSDAKLLRQI